MNYNKLFFFLLCFIFWSTPVIAGIGDDLKRIEKLIKEQSEGWIVEVEKITENLPKELRDILSQDVKTLVDGSVSSVGVEVRCNVDIAVNGLTQSVGKLLDHRHWTNKIMQMIGLADDQLGIKETQPYICSVQPNPIKVSNDSGRSTQKLTWFGRGIEPDNLRIHAVCHNDERVDLTKFFATASSYEGTIVFDDTQVVLHPQYRRIEFSDAKGRSLVVPFANEGATLNSVLIDPEPKEPKIIHGALYGRKIGAQNQYSSAAPTRGRLKGINVFTAQNVFSAVFGIEPEIEFIAPEMLGIEHGAESSFPITEGDHLKTISFYHARLTSSNLITESVVSLTLTTANGRSQTFGLPLEGVAAQIGNQELKTLTAREGFEIIGLKVSLQIPGSISQIGIIERELAPKHEIVGCPKQI